MEYINKKEMMEFFEKHLDEIRSNDKSKFLDMPQTIKKKMFEIGDKMLENWTSDNIVTEEFNNKIIKYSKDLKKK